MKIILSLLVVGLAGAFLVWRQVQLEELEKSNRKLEEQLQKAVTLARQNSKIPELRKQLKEFGALQEEARDLHKLRNEYSQLKQQLEEFETVQEENARLKNLKAKRNSEVKTSQKPPEDYIRADLVADRGFGTPESTVQTFFWAAKNGAVERFHESRGENVPDWIQADPKRFERQKEEMQKDFKDFPGFRIVEKVEEEPTDSENGISQEETVTLKLQSNPGGTLHSMTLVRTPMGWKIRAFGRSFP